MSIIINTNNNSDFTEAFLSWDLFKFAEEYYITSRILYFNTAVINCNIIYHSIIHNWAECFEKIIKFYLSTKNKNFKYNDLKKYSHNFNLLVSDWQKINKSLFSNYEMINFAKQYTKMWNQVFRYWRNSDYKNKDFLSNYYIDVNSFISMIDNTFISILNDLYNDDGDWFFQAFWWIISELYDFRAYNTLKEKEKIKLYLTYNNQYIESYLKNLKSYSLKIKNE